MKRHNFCSFIERTTRVSLGRAIYTQYCYVLVAKLFMFV